MSGKITPNYIAVRKGDSFTIRFQFKCGNEFVDISGSSLKKTFHADIYTRTEFIYTAIEI